MSRSILIAGCLVFGIACGRAEVGGLPSDSAPASIVPAPAIPVMSASDAGAPGRRHPGMPTPASCAGLMGYVCGSRVGLAPDSLYSCADDADAGPALVQQCSGACEVRDGGGDGCPCPNGNGTYCGGDVGRASNAVFQCTGGQLTQLHTCESGCNHIGDGGTDSCNPCQYGDGLYCGGPIGQDPNTLFQCQGGVLSVAQLCGHTCTTEPVGVNDNCGACPEGDGLYCGGPVGLNANTLYSCKGGYYTAYQACSNTCHSAPSGTNDYCNGTGLSCSNVQWWNSPITYQHMVWNGGIDWVDTDLALASWTPVQLRHDSVLLQDPVEPWGWQPRFRDLVTGQVFQFLHLHPQAQYTTGIGMVYPAGTIVGRSGGDTYDTGYNTYSTGAHLCLETIAAWRTAFPAGTDACN